jgi:hypothetical protein
MAAAACLALVGVAHASTRINIGSMTADGQEVRNLSCDLDSGGFFAGIAIVGGLAKKKKAFDACVKTGAAFQISWRWDGSSAKDLKVTGGTDAQNACISKAFQVISGPVKGRCSAVLLAGKKDEAQKAAEALLGKPADKSDAAPDAKPDAKPDASKPATGAAAGGKAASSDPLK